MKKQLMIAFWVGLFLPTVLTAQQADKPVYKNLVMEGGGVKGIAYGGALSELESRGILRGITRVAGTSAGAIQAALLAVGYSAEEITDIIANTPIESFNDDGFVVRASRRLVKQYGWFKGEKFHQQLQQLLQQRTGKAELTFADLHALAATYPFRDLYVTGANLSSQKVEIFSYEKYPNMKVADAVRISMSIPMYYQAVWVSKNGEIIEHPTPADSCSLFVDGGLLMNYPIGIFDEARYAADSASFQQDFNAETIGLRLDRCEQIDHEIGQKNGNAPYQITDFSTYVSALTNAVMRNVAPPHPRDAERTIFINDLGMSSRVRKMSSDEITQLMGSGRLGVTDFFARLGN